MSMVAGSIIGFGMWFFVCWIVGLFVGGVALALWSHIGWGARVLIVIHQLAWLGFTFFMVAFLILIILYGYDFYTCPNLYDSSLGKGFGHFKIGRGPGQVNKCATKFARFVFIIALILIWFGLIFMAKYNASLPLFLTLGWFFPLQVLARKAIRPRNATQSELKMMRENYHLYKDAKDFKDDLERVLVKSVVHLKDKFFYYKAAALATLFNAFLFM